MAAIAVSRLPKAVMTTTGRSGRLTVQLVAQRDAGRAGHVVVGDDDVDVLGPHEGQGLGGRVPGQRLEAPARELGHQQIAHGPVVLDQQHPGLHDAASLAFSRGRKSSKRLPLPGVLSTAIQPP